MALLTLPVVIVSVEEAIRTVPRELREASFALGATKWQTIRKVVIPGSISGIMTGTILAVSRGQAKLRLFFSQVLLILSHTSNFLVRPVHDWVIIFM